ncbi:MAG: glycosyltransferase [Candidatus Zixiibacteriota bacterium]|nr:MAG: glycosyltransferase [candidate division Zixibacteria bacterium]
MTTLPLLSLILPGTDTPEQRKITLKPLSILKSYTQLILLPGVSIPEGFPHVVTLEGEPPVGLAQLINCALPQAQGVFLAVAPPGLNIAIDLFMALSRSAKDDTDYIYGDYFQESPEKSSPVLSQVAPGDITEREDWGPLEFYRVEALRRIGGADESLRFRPDYDLRLKLTQDRPATRLDTVFYTVPQTQSQDTAAASALFFPGRGKFGGFSYLFMDPAEEKEIEEIFYRFLQRTGAWLEAPTGNRFAPGPGTSPRVSVVIPIHNRAGFLPLSVGSVQRGTFQDFEIIIVDNASTDDTLDAARDLAAQDPRIRVLSLPDNVIAKALNAGVREARGEYVAQLDSDDEYTPDTLASAVRHLDEHPEEGLAISYYELMDPEGKTLEEFGVIKHLEYNRNNILRVDGAGAVRVWRRAAILEFGGFNEQDFGHYGEDYDLVLKVGEKYEVGRIHEVLYRYRRHPGNSDVLRAHEMKILNKTLARQRALERRRAINRKGVA